MNYLLIAIGILFTTLLLLCVLIEFSGIKEDENENDAFFREHRD